MRRFACPYFRSTVELTDEREQHIAENHSNLHSLDEYPDCIAETLENPDEISADGRFPTTLRFSRWFESIEHGKHVVVVVVSDVERAGRHWIVTAFMTRRPSRRGELIWTRN